MVNQSKSKWIHFAPELWTKNFLILSLGSIVSIAGASTVSILFGLMILDITDSAIYYSVLLAIGNVAGTIIPILCASFVERCAKQKIVYACDFCSATLFAIVAVVCKLGWVSGSAVLLMSLMFETILRVYQTAYLSLLPALVKKELFQKAYSITSLIENIGSSACLVGVLGYDIFGAVPILLFCSVCFFVAACFETQIKPERTVGPIEDEDSDMSSPKGLKAYINNYAEVFQFLRKIPGMIELLAIWFFNYIHLGAMWAMLLPFFKYVYPNNTIFGYEINRDYIYMIFFTFYGFGQFLGSGISYGVDAKKEKRFFLFFLFIILESLSVIVFPALPVLGAILLILLSGFFGIYTYSLFQAVVFEKVPKTMRARVTGVITSLQALMMIVGNLWSGWIIEKSSYPQHGFLVTTLPILCVVVLILILRRKALKTYFSTSEDRESKTNAEQIDASV